MKTCCRVTVFLVLAGSVLCPAAQETAWQATGKGGAVAAGGSEAVAAGITMLERGGNAADAAVATLLALTVTDYGFFAFGAEVPFMFYDANTREVTVLSGLGGAPLSPEAIEWYYRHGIPAQGSLRAAPVPGAPGLFMTALARHGTMTLGQVAQPTLDLLKRGDKDWHGALADTLNRLIETERTTVGTREEKLQSASDRFYKGDIADELVAYYRENGGFLQKADLMAHVTRVEKGVSVNYRGYTVYKCGPWTQGPSLCQTLRLLKGYDLKAMGHLSADYIHVLTESLKLAFADRDFYYGDPLLADVPMKALLAEEYTVIRRGLIDMAKASDQIRPGDPINLKAVRDGGVYEPGPGGTTTCVVADRWGNFVAATPSGNGPYAICEGLGIAHGNRLRCFNTRLEHPNRMEPGKRPRITLTPTLVLKEGQAVMAISVAGGDLQDQTTLNCLLNHIEFGMLPAEAVTAARFSTGHHQNSFDPNPNRRQTVVELAGLTVNTQIDQTVRSDLQGRGHKLHITEGPIASPVMIVRQSESGMIYAAGDPRTGRHAAALE